ncbi:MAG: TonB-dependent receptor [Bacteroidota bacterium]
MKKVYTLLLLLAFPFILIKAQNATISGQVYDQSNQSIIGANIVLLKPVDSVMIKGTTTDVNGNFKLQIAQQGTFLIKISFIGYEDIFITKKVSNQPLSLGKLILKDKVTKLTTVSVVAEMTPVQQKGDTTQINAGAFKTNPDANAEDLITKMPGITLQDGKVQAQGESVQKVLVDGQEFFGDDANAVLKNLPAEVVDKIQIFDKKSEQSEATGFDDGNTTKTINIVTKTQFKNGIFGKVLGGYGYEDKWKGGMNLNFFKDKRRISILANTNNVNEQNFSSEDLLGVMSSGSGSSGRRGGGRPSGGGLSNDAGNFLVDQKSGITATNSFGLNYANQWKKVNFSGSYFINYSDNNSENNLYRQYVTSQNEGLSYQENQTSNSQNINHRINFKIDWKIDSLNSLMLQPKISIQQNDASSKLNGQNSLLSIIQNITQSNYSSSLSGLNISLPINYRHSFSKKGRSFSISLNPGYNKNNGNNNLNSLSYYSDTLTLDQLANRDVQGIIFSTNIAYSEPLSKQSQLMFSYGTNFNKSNSIKETFNYSNTDLQYNIFDTILSNTYNSQYLSQTFGTSFRYQQTKWNFSTGISFQYAQLNGDQTFPIAFALNKTFNSILPNAQFQYKFTNKKNLRINYRSSNKAPSISQLQNVINNNNPLQLTTGNPELKQDWQNSFTLRYSSSSSEKSRSFMALLSSAFTQNYIVNNTTIASQDSIIAPGITLARGSQLSRPINLNGYFNIRSFNNVSFPIAFIKSILSLNLGGTYTKTPGMINNQINYSNSYNVGLGFALSSNISQSFDFTLSSNTTYNNISNTLQSSLNSDYYNQNSKLKIQVMPWKWMVIQSDVNHQYNSGLSTNYNQNYFLWNAAIGCKFLKDNKAELRLSIFDIMKQNNSISRNTTEIYYEDVRTNVLQQYAMLTFTYNIKYYHDTKAKANK